MGVALSCLLTFAACTLFALVMKRHQRDALRRTLSPRTVQASRLVAALLMAAAPIPWMVERGALMGLVAWLFCATPLAGMGTAALLVCLASRPARRTR